ncbi:MAG: DUF5947 family protein [Stellaceae bacterium]
MPGSNGRHWPSDDSGGERVLRGNWVATLRRFVDSPTTEQCELCGSGLGAAHQHLVEPANRRLLCACESCVAKIAAARDSEYRVVPSGARLLPDFHMTDAEWDALRLPIDMAFLFHSTPERRLVALYPGPAGATESLLSLDAWEQLVARNPALAGLEPDVEALLVNRIDEAREYYRVPIDRCFALVGLIRTRWRGLSGGAEAWQAIRDFFAQLRDPVATRREWRHG